jgi:ABC-type branched-subunit amino acid transport system ATPase component/ABC-type branched-subunit amino acid transport system permease subunit
VLEAGDRLHRRSVPLAVLLGLELPAGVLVTGLLIGLTYGVLAAGLVLVFRSSGVINFAHAETGALGAALLARMVTDGGVPWAVALPVALAVGAAVGAVVEVSVVRRLRAAPRVVLLVATLGVSQLLLVAQFSLPEAAQSGALFPVPFERTVELGAGIVLDASAFLALGLVPAAVVVLALFLERTPTGLAVRAAADNREAAELAGISTARTSTLVWSLAGALAVLTVVLSNGLLRTRVGDIDLGLGPGLLLRALVAALVARFVSLPLALAAGIVLGVVDAVVLVNVASAQGIVDAGLFVAVLLLVLYRAVRDGRLRGGDDAVQLAGLTAERPIPAVLRQTWWAPRLGLLTWSVAGLLALCVPLLGLDAGQLQAASRVPLFAIVGLSLVVLTGWAGQLSLGQVALYGLGAFTCAALVERGVPFPAAVAQATIAGVLAALVIGLPALLVRGLFLAVTTLAFAVAASSALFQSSLFVGESRVATVDPGTLLGLDLRNGTTYYYLCLAALLVCCLAVSALRRSGAGRAIIAVRANADRAASMTLSPAVVRLSAFAVSGGLAAFAGALLAGLQRSISSAQFPVFDSLVVVALVMIGGVGSVAGAVLGALWVFGLPALLGGGDVVRLLTSAIGLLVLLLYLPGGLRSLLLLARDGLLDAVARRRPQPPGPDPSTGSAAAPVARVREPEPRGGPSGARVDAAGVAGAEVGGADPDLAVRALEARGLVVRFGGRTALDGVDLVVHQGEVLGLIGANGAGKSTLLAAVSGFVTPQSGTVQVLGRDVTNLSAAQRARVGMGRIFQDARLFDDLTVRECLLVALEARERSEVVPSLLTLPPSRAAERRKAVLADDVLSSVGLGRYAHAQVRTLSTGTRRVVELGCLVAQDARVLLLDEPTAGLAQREAEAFGPLLLQLRRDLDATLVVVEHDLPLLLGISDRVQCLGAGRTLALGPPEQVRNDPEVVAAYLGADVRAVARSGELG